MNCSMFYHRASDEESGRIALYSLGLLDADEASELEAHLADGCDECARELSELQEASAALASSGHPIPSPPRVRDKVLEITTSQIWKQWRTDTNRDLHVVRDGEGKWHTVRPGVHAKQLYVDRSRDMVTMLVRMEPGASWVPHRHAAPEQCFVLEGDIEESGHSFQAGDFQCAAADSIHGAQRTRQGCLLLIVSSLHDELLSS